MITQYLKTSAPVSRSMLLLSLCLHGFFLGAVICVYPLFLHSPKPVEIRVSRVKLVEPKIGPPVPEILQQDRGKADLVDQSREIAQSKIASRAPDATPETVRPKLVPEDAQKSIPLKKRQRPLERVEAPKVKKPREPKEKPPEKKEDPRILLEQKLAAIRNEVEKRKIDLPAKRSDPERAQNPNIVPTGLPGSDDSQGNQELMRWLDTVRSRINAHWSLFGDNRDLRRVTVVGVRIADDGNLTDAGVDKSSGDEVFDRSAMRAVFQAAPFPAVPSRVRELIRREGGLALRFTPSGIQ